MDSTLGENNTLHEKKGTSVVEHEVKNSDAFLMGEGHIIDDEDEQNTLPYRPAEQARESRPNALYVRQKPLKIGPNVFIKEIVNELIDEISYETITANNERQAAETTTIDYALSSTATLLSYTPHLIPLMLGIASFNTKDHLNKEAFTKICGACFLGYYFRFFHHGNLDDTHTSGLQQNIYFYATLYGGTSNYLPIDRFALGVFSFGFGLFKKFR